MFNMRNKFYWYGATWGHNSSLEVTGAPRCVGWSRELYPRLNAAERIITSAGQTSSTDGSMSLQPCTGFPSLRMTTKLVRISPATPIIEEEEGRSLTVPAVKSNQRFWDFCFKSKRTERECGNAQSTYIYSMPTFLFNHVYRSDYRCIGREFSTIYKYGWVCHATYAENQWRMMSLLFNGIAVQEPEEALVVAVGETTAAAWRRQRAQPWLITKWDTENNMGSRML